MKIIYDVEGDGNCLFRAVSLLMEGHEYDYEKYRKLCCETILKNRERIEPYLSKSALEKKGGKYVENLKDQGLLE